MRTCRSRANLIFALFKMREGPCWAPQQGPARCGSAPFFAAQNALGSLLAGATRTRAMWPHPIFYRMGCARVLAVLGNSKKLNNSITFKEFPRQQGPARIPCDKKQGGGTWRGSLLRRPARTLAHFVLQKMKRDHVARVRVAPPNKDPGAFCTAKNEVGARPAWGMYTWTRSSDSRSGATNASSSRSTCAPRPSARARTPLWESPEALPSELPPRWGQAVVARRADRGGCRLHHRYPVYVLALVPLTEPRP